MTDVWTFSPAKDSTQTYADGTVVPHRAQLLLLNGEAVGVLWACSRNFEDRAYAIDPVEAGALIRDQLNSGEIDELIDLTRCY